MTCLMPCAYSEINKFENQLVINASVLTTESCDKNVYSDMTGRVSISFYSLSQRQKWSNLTLAALAIITLLVGVSSLVGANFIGTKAAFAMIGVGGGVFVIVAGAMSSIHLIFVKQVGQYLRSLDKNEIENWWENAAKYPGNKTWQGLTGFINRDDDTGGFHIKLDNENTLLGRRYGVYDNDLKFCIEFHKTHSAHVERLLQKIHKA